MEHVLRSGGHHGHFFPNTLCEEPPWLTVYIPALMKIFCTFSATRSASSSLMERHLLPAAPQQPPPSLVLTVGLEVRGRPSAALSVTETVSFGFGFF